MDFILPTPEHAPAIPIQGYPAGYPPGMHPINNTPILEQQPQFMPLGPMPPGSTFLGDPSNFMADENLLELMKWGASSMGPDMFGTGMWPFQGDTPSSHSGNKQF
jgi:hypothetical protein